MKNALIVVAVIAALGLGVLLTVAGTYNGLVSQEKAVTATWRDSQVQYDRFWKTVRETAQVTDKYAEDFKAIFIGSIEGRYEGKDPAVQFLMESNPKLDSSMYERLARLIEVGRADFAQTQRTLVDRQRAYETALARFPTNLLASSLGFPNEIHGEYAPTDDVDGDGRKTVLDYRTVTSGRTQEVFMTGREDEPLDVFGGAR